MSLEIRLEEGRGERKEGKGGEGELEVEGERGAREKEITQPLASLPGNIQPQFWRCSRWGSLFLTLELFKGVEKKKSSKTRRQIGLLLRAKVNLLIPPPPFHLPILPSQVSPSLLSFADSLPIF